MCVAIVALSYSVNAHTLQPGECVAYASDAERFMDVKMLGWSVDDADEGLRKMLEDGRWFSYVRDKEDVERLRTTVHSLWDLDDSMSPKDGRERVLTKADPE